MVVESDPSPSLAIVRILVAQAVLGAVLAVIGFGVDGAVAGYSALLGCLICVLPNTVLALHIMAGGLVRDARRLVRASYFGMALKLVLTAALFTIAFVTVRPLAPGWLFAGFIVTQAVIWVAPVLARDGRTTVTE
jgi:ATP synthase protein I